MRHVELAFVSASILLATTLLSGQIPQVVNPTGRLEIEVVDQAKEPISNAFVYVHYSYSFGTVGDVQQKDVVVPLGESGRGQSVLRAGLFDVFAAAPGFTPDCRIVEVRSGKSTSALIRMKPDSERLQDLPRRRP